MLWPRFQGKGAEGWIFTIPFPWASRRFVPIDIFGRFIPFIFRFPLSLVPLLVAISFFYGMLALLISRNGNGQLLKPRRRSSLFHSIEMCEKAVNSSEQTLDRTARLLAWLRKTHDIPISGVVPHQHWSRIRPTDGLDIGAKNCPRFLTDNGVPGPKWQAFLERIQHFVRQWPGFGAEQQILSEGTPRRERLGRC